MLARKSKAFGYLNKREDGDRNALRNRRAPSSMRDLCRRDIGADAGSISFDDPAKCQDQKAKERTREDGRVRRAIGRHTLKEMVAVAEFKVQGGQPQDYPAQTDEEWVSAFRIY
jgi:hypothetical protein